MNFSALTTLPRGVAMYGNDERSCIETKGMVKAIVAMKAPPIIPRATLFGELWGWLCIGVGGAIFWVWYYYVLLTLTDPVITIIIIMVHLHSSSLSSPIQQLPCRIGYSVEEGDAGEKDHGGK